MFVRDIWKCNSSFQHEINDSLHNRRFRWVSHQSNCRNWNAIKPHPSIHSSIQYIVETLNNISLLYFWDYTTTWAHVPLIGGRLCFTQVELQLLAMETTTFTNNSVKSLPTEEKISQNNVLYYFLLLYNLYLIRW